MKVEYNTKKPEAVKKNRKRKKRNRIVAAVLSIIIVLAVTVVLMLTVFFKVNSIKVIGSSIYSSDDIIYASGIMIGDNLLKLPSDDIETRIEEALPYIKKATVIKKMPNTVGIEVTPADEVILFENTDGKYVCDADYKVLRVVNENPEGLLRIKGISTDSVTVGKTISFSVKQQRDILTELKKICDDKGFDVGYINVESAVNLSFTISDRLYIKLGSYNDISGKLAHLEAMLPSIDKDVTASISLDAWSVNNKEAVLKYEDITNLIN